MDVILDLFGDPVSPHHGQRGRPQHVPTQENRHKVNLLLSLGWSNERIAAALRITLPTLRRHYFSELKFREVARDRLDATLAMHLWKQVEVGNVGAMREFGRFVERNDMMLGHAHFYGKRDADEKPERLGKKEVAAKEAESAGEGSDWGDDLKPPVN